MAKLATSTFFLLIVAGLAMLASASVVEAQRLCGSTYCLVWHQMLYGFVPGLIAFAVCAKIPARSWRRFALPIFLLAVALLVLIFVPGIGREVRGAQRWLDLRVVTIQPAEFLKLALVLYLAAWFSSTKRTTASIIPFLLVLGFVIFLLILQPDFGTLGIVVLIAVAMYFFSGARWTHFAGLLIALVMALGIMSVAAPYRFERVKTFLDPHADQQGSGYHIKQALIGIGSGGMWGRGYGQSQQKISYLPEPVGDSIFAVIVEELGLVGGAALIGLFLMFLLALIVLSRHAPDPFGRLFILGFAVWAGGQAFINIAAISGIIPLTGVPLPLISYGSSALVSLMAGMGMVRSISKVST